MKKDLFSYLAGGWLLAMGIAHGWGYYKIFLEGEDVPIARKLLFGLMERHDQSGLFSPMELNYLVLFSLTLAAMLFLGGLVTIFVTARAEATFKSEYALFSMIFWLATGFVYLAAEAVIQPLAICGAAALLFALAWRRG